MKEKSWFSTLLQIRVNEDEAKDLDHILLHIRHKSLVVQDPKGRRKSILMGLPFVWLLQLLMLPLTAVSYFKTLLIGLLIAAIPFLVFEVLDLRASLILWMIVWAGLNINHILQSFVELLFDLLDFFTLGKLTLLAVSAYSELPIEKQRSIITKYNAKFIQHLYTSRLSYGDNHHPQWESYFLSVFKYFSDDKSILQIEIENYWSEAKKDEPLHDRFQPLVLTEHMDWIEHRDWPRATPAVVKFVINRLSNINETQTSWTENGITGPRTLLGTAAAAGANIELIKMIVGAGADLNFTQSAPMSFRGYEFSIIHCAVAGSNFEVVKYLLDNGVNLEKAYKNHLYTIAQFATLFASDAIVLGLIIDRSSPTNLIDERGNTLLHYALASSTDRSSQIALLAKKGMDMNLTNERGETPAASFANGSVHITGQEGYPNVNNLLTAINLGADPNIKTKDNSSPLGLLANQWRGDNNLLDAAKALVVAGAEIDHVDDHGDTPLYKAIGNDLELTRYLLEKGADVNRPNTLSESPFTKAVRQSFSTKDVSEYVKMIELLLSHGANPKAQIYALRGDRAANKRIIQRLKTHNFDFTKLKKSSPIKKLFD